MNSKLIISSLIFLLCFAGPVVASAQNQDKNKKNRVDELLLWKVSEELKLKVTEEQQLDRLLSNLRQKKSDIQATLDNAIDNLEKATGKIPDQKIQKKWIAEYRKALKSLSDLNVEEIDRISKTFGTTAASKYLIAKSNLSEKIKNLLKGNAPEAEAPPATGAPLPEPKIIEE